MKEATTTQRVAQLEAAVDALSQHVQDLQAMLIAQVTAQSTAPKARDYGPDSERAMDDRMALRILVGRYRTWTVRKIADECGLSRGQVYSLRGGYTFKQAHKVARAIEQRRAERRVN